MSGFIQIWSNTIFTVPAIFGKSPCSESQMLSETVFRLQYRRHNSYVLQVSLSIAAFLYRLSKRA